MPFKVIVQVFELEIPADVVTVKVAVKELLLPYNLYIASNCVSDVFGGISRNQVSGAWGHSTEYWMNRGQEAVGKEAFAEITADRACNNANSLAFTQKYLPRTIQAYERALKIGG